MPDLRLMCRYSPSSVHTKLRAILTPSGFTDAYEGSEEVSSAACCCNSPTLHAQPDHASDPAGLSWHTCAPVLTLCINTSAWLQLLHLSAKLQASAACPLHACWSLSQAASRQMD